MDVAEIHDKLREEMRDVWENAKTKTSDPIEEEPTGTDSKLDGYEEYFASVVEKAGE
jgi:hypothetical protein